MWNGYSKIIPIIKEKLYTCMGMSVIFPKNTNKHTPPYTVQSYASAEMEMSQRCHQHAKC